MLLRQQHLLMLLLGGAANLDSAPGDRLALITPLGNVDAPLCIAVRKR